MNQNGDSVKDLLKTDLARRQNLVTATDSDPTVRGQGWTAKRTQKNYYCQDCDFQANWMMSLRYPITKALTVMLSKTFICFDLCIAEFIDLRRINGLDGDAIKEDYDLVISKPKITTMLRDSDEDKDSVDDLFSQSFNLWVLGKNVYIYDTLTLSWECRYGTKVLYLQDKLQEESLIAKRIICGEDEEAGGSAALNSHRD